VVISSSLLFTFTPAHRLLTGVPSTQPLTLRELSLRSRTKPSVIDDWHFGQIFERAIPSSTAREGWRITRSGGGLQTGSARIRCDDRRIRADDSASGHDPKALPDMLPLQLCRRIRLVGRNPKSQPA